MSYIDKGFGTIANLEERNAILRELVTNGYDIKFNARAARNINENITVFYNPQNFRHMLLFKDSFTCFYCEAYFAPNSKLVLA